MYNKKQKSCLELGYRSIIKRLPENVSFDQVIDVIEELNQTDTINGILLQLPTPKHLDSFELLKKIDPEKDVDGLHPYNLGLLFSNRKNLVPCTPQGCIQLIKRACSDLKGKRAVVLGRSVLVGKTLAILLTHNNASVTLLHSQSKDIPDICKEADIIISAVGKPLFVKKDFIKDGAIVIDVGINKIDGKIVGDVDFTNVAPLTSFITPVPKGVGPMTVVNLMINTMASFFQFSKMGIPNELQEILN